MKYIKIEVVILIDDILIQYQMLCATDPTNRERLKSYNNIQCEIMKDSALDVTVWISRYAYKFAVLIDYVDTVKELKEDVYR